MPRLHALTGSIIICTNDFYIYTRYKTGIFCAGGANVRPLSFGLFAREVHSEQTDSERVDWLP